MSTIAELQPKPLWEYFERLSQIPRPSKHEERYDNGAFGIMISCCADADSGCEAYVYDHLPGVSKL